MRLVAVGLGVVAVLCGLAGAVLRTPGPAVTFWLLGAVAAVAFGATGAILAARARAPIVAWTLTFIGLGHGIAVFARGYGQLALDHGLPFAAAAVWVGSWLWVTGHIAIATILPLLLPDGTLPSPRWRPALALGVAVVATTTVSWALLPYDLQEFPPPGPVTNPFGTAVVASMAVEISIIALTLLALIASLGSLVARWRIATGVRRQQLKCLALGAILTVALAGLALSAPAALGEALAAVAVLPIPLACGVAAVRYRLWDVDLALSRTLVVSALTVIVVATYTVIVGVLSGLLGVGTGTPVLASAVAVLVVLPLHSRVQRLVNHLVHSDDDDPATALVRIGEKLAATTDAKDVAERLLPEVVTRLARLLRTSYAALELGDGTIVAHGHRPPLVDSVPLRYNGAHVGSLVLDPHDRSRSERRRLEVLAAQAAVAVHTVLLARDASRSRQLAATAREEERHRIRRDLHDGMGPVLAAVALQAESARELISCDPAAAASLLDRMVPLLNNAVADVRTLVHDLRPPALDTLGLEGAVHELVARFGHHDLAIRLRIGTLSELSAAVDVAAYRIVSEALVNALRHSDASTITISLHCDDGWLHLGIEDDGHGIAPGNYIGLGLESMRQRAQELNGTCTVLPRSGSRGTTVRATLPLGASA